MSNEHNIKKGDRVRYTGKFKCYVQTDIDPNQTYTVKRMDGDEVVIDVPSEGVIYGKDLELVESCDRKTAFLRELQALLKTYDARIYDGELYAIHIEVGYHGKDSEQVDYLFYQSDNNEINADNIMDFDKE